MKTIVEMISSSETRITGQGMSLVIEAHGGIVTISDDLLGCLVELQPQDARALGEALLTVQGKT